MKYIILIACFIRLFTQMFANDTLYAIGIFSFELFVLIYIYSVFEYKTLIMFFIGVASYDLFKYMFLKPNNIDVWEYINTIIGLLFIFVKYVIKKSNRFSNLC